MKFLTSVTHVAMWRLRDQHDFGHNCNLQGVVGSLHLVRNAVGDCARSCVSCTNDLNCTAHCGPHMAAGLLYPLWHFDLQHTPTPLSANPACQNTRGQTAQPASKKLKEGICLSIVLLQCLAVLPPQAVHGKSQRLSEACRSLCQRPHYQFTMHLDLGRRVQSGILLAEARSLSACALPLWPQIKGLGASTVLAAGSACFVSLWLLVLPPIRRLIGTASRT